LVDPAPVDTIMLLLGAALGAVFVALAERRTVKTTNLLYGLGLVAASLAYVGFVWRGGADAWLTTEIGGTLVFAGVAVGGVRNFRYMLALGWLLHAGWDTLLHTGPGADWVPAWYVPLCVGFDLIVAGGILKGVLPSRD